jgi:hypothetical protein
VSWSDQHDQFSQLRSSVEDAFQATFLILIRKAATLRDRESLSKWLFGAANASRGIRARVDGAAPPRYGFAAERIVLTGRNNRISSSSSATNPNRS